MNEVIFFNLFWSDEASNERNRYFSRRSNYEQQQFFLFFLKRKIKYFKDSKILATKWLKDFC